jgi:hypothetical protein
MVVWTFCLGVAWLCGREVVWSLACFGAALTAKVSRGIVPLSPTSIDSADTSQPPNVEFAWTNHILYRGDQVFSCFD